eukprot:7079899-Lingulodinium_polyedra.AAC.1
MAARARSGARRRSGCRHRLGASERRRPLAAGAHSHLGHSRGRHRACCRGLGGWRCFAGPAPPSLPAGAGI